MKLTEIQKQMLISKGNAMFIKTQEALAEVNTSIKEQIMNTVSLSYMSGIRDTLDSLEIEQEDIEDIVLIATGKKYE